MLARREESRRIASYASGERRLASSADPEPATPSTSSNPAQMKQTGDLRFSIGVWPLEAALGFLPGLCGRVWHRILPRDMRYVPSRPGRRFPRCASHWRHRWDGGPPPSLRRNDFIGAQAPIIVTSTETCSEERRWLTRACPRTAARNFPTTSSASSHSRFLEKLSDPTSRLRCPTYEPTKRQVELQTLHQLAFRAYRSASAEIERREVPRQRLECRFGQQPDCPQRVVSELASTRST